MFAHKVETCFKKPRNTVETLTIGDIDECNNAKEKLSVNKNARRGRPPVRQMHVQKRLMYRVVQKTDPQFYFWDNFGNSAPILTILLLLQAEIYAA